MAVVVVLLALVCSRSAMAYAPFCDITATSQDAPPPILPVADIRFEADRDVFLWTWYRGEMGDAITEARSHTSSPGLTPAHAASSVDVGVLSRATAHVPPSGSQPMCWEQARRCGPNGYAPSVYRPPR